MGNKDQNNEYTFTVANTDSFQVIEPTVKTMPPVPPVEKNPKKGRAARKWSLFFFIMSALSLILISMTFVLPLFSIFLGLIVGFLWIMFILIGTLVTIGLMWTVEGVRAANANWLTFLGDVFGSTQTIVNYATTIVPIVTWTGAAFYLATWLFMIIGAAKDKARKKYYTGMIIALSILTVLYLALSIASNLAVKQ